MKTFYNQTTEDEFLTLPYKIAQEVIQRMKLNKNCFIHLITIKFIDGVLKQTIKYHYNGNAR
jgi:hypothetical protein